MRCLIIDDDREFSEYLYGYIDDFFKKIFKKYTIDILNNDFGRINQYQSIDILFVDIDLNDINGISVIKEMKKTENNSLVIYVSSRKELVFSSLSTHPFYFVRKQNLKEDLEELFKLLNRYYKKTMKMITFDYYGRKTSIFLKDIHYITSYGHDISIITDQETYTYRSSLKDAIKLIDSKYVIQVHRNYAISLMYVKEIEKMNLCLKDNTKINIGKKYYENFMSLYKEYLIS